MRTRASSGRCSILLTGLLLTAANAVAADAAFDAWTTAAQYRREGNIRLAIDILERARTQLGNSCPTQIKAELGANYYQSNRLADAERILLQAYAEAPSAAERALVANDLGNLFVTLGKRDAARKYYNEARGATEPAIAVSAGLNLARLTLIEEDRRKLLTSLEQSIGGMTDGRERTRYLINLGNQARTLRTPDAALASRSLTSARNTAQALNDKWLLAEALDGLAQLSEDTPRGDKQALQLTAEALSQLGTEPPQELSINLQWRRGRLERRARRPDQALAAYQSAVDMVEALRQDIPIQYVDGRSSFRQTLAPIYLGLADLLLETATTSRGTTQQRLYRRARDTIELVKQSELQDYLGSRCAFGNAKPLEAAALPARTAVLYPVILKNRLELLLETPAGIEVRQVAVGERALREKMTQFAGEVNGIKLGDIYLKKAREAYDLLLRPVEAVLTQQQIDTLVVVPDGVLRLVPFAALHDGQSYAIEKYAVAVVPGLTTRSFDPMVNSRGQVLLAGVSNPGPVVDVLPSWVTSELQSQRSSQCGATDLACRLRLDGVAQEIDGLKRDAPAATLLNENFTTSRFQAEVSSGKYRVVHIASHAFLRSDARSSFLMAYDGLISFDQLQSLLNGEQLRSKPLDLLSLSACQTAKGDDRAPLGIAGAALKAQARSALGSLWPVADDSTTELMQRFYGELTKGEMSKAKALQRAQREVSRQPGFQHPYFWAAFVLVGDWR